MSKLLTLTLESGEKAKVPFNETSMFRITTRTYPDPAGGPVDVEQAYSGVTSLAVTDIRGEEPLPPPPGKYGFESADAAITHAATLPLGEGAAHLEQALIKWPKSGEIKAELERYDKEIRATPNDSATAPAQSPNVAAPTEPITAETEEAAPA